MKNLWKFTVVLVVAFGVATAAQAIPIVQHVGDVDPSTEGFTSTGSGGAAGVVDGRICWFLDGASGYWTYPGALADSGLTGQDWTLYFDAWVGDQMAWEGTIQIGVRPGGDRHADFWLTPTLGEQQVPWVKGTEWSENIRIAGPQVGWHEYAISMDESENLVTWYIDNVPVRTAPPCPIHGGDDAVIWGNHHGAGSGAYVAVSHLEFMPGQWIPEPASLCLLCLGGLGLVRRRR